MCDRYLVVSDIHGRDEKLELRLSIIAKNNPPKIAFFLGDVIGTYLLDQLQKLFYNGVYNHIKKLLQDNPYPTRQEILSYPIGNGKSLATGVAELKSFLRNIHPTTIDLIDPVEYTLALSEYVHFGHFVSNLPKKIRESLQKDLESNAQVWIDIMTSFIQKGSKVVVIEGNWDARNPLDFVRSKKHCTPLPIRDRKFYFKNFLQERNPNILYFDRADIIKDRNNFFVILPFDSVINLDLPEFTDLDHEKKIIISHTQATWHAIKGDTPMTAEGEKIQDNMAQIIDKIKPETIIHGHLHDKPPINSPYYLYGNITVEYLPLRTARFIDL